VWLIAMADGPKAAVAVRPGGGRLTERTADARLVGTNSSMPHTCRSQCPSGSAQLGGNPSFVAAIGKMGEQRAPLSGGKGVAAYERHYPKLIVTFLCY